MKLHNLGKTLMIGFLLNSGRVVGIIRKDEQISDEFNPTNPEKMLTGLNVPAENCRHLKKMREIYCQNI